MMSVFVSPVIAAITVGKKLIHPLWLLIYLRDHFILYVVFYIIDITVLKCGACTIFFFFFMKVRMQ